MKIYNKICEYFVNSGEADLSKLSQKITWFYWIFSKCNLALLCEIIHRVFCTFLLQNKCQILLRVWLDEIDIESMSQSASIILT